MQLIIFDFYLSARKKNTALKLIKVQLYTSSLFFIFAPKQILMYKTLAKINKVVLPSFTKKQLDPAKAKKWQLAILAYRYYVTSRALSSK